MITPGGLALGTLVAGALAQYGPAPLRLVYGVYLGALVALVAGVAALPETVPAATGRLAFHMQRLHVPADIRRPFAAAAFGVFSGFVVMGLLSGLAPSFLGESLHEHNVFVAGLLVSVMFGAAASVPLVVGRRAIGTAALLGVACVIAGLTLVLVALATRSLASSLPARWWSAWGSARCLPARSPWSTATPRQTAAPRWCRPSSSPATPG